MKHPHFFKYLIPLFLFTIIGISASAQNGWARKDGGLYLQGTLSTFSSDQYYSRLGKLIEGNTFNSHGFLIYGEYGITDQLTSVVHLPLVMFHNFSGTETVAGLGDIRLGLKYQLTRSFPLSVQVEAEIPTDDGILLASADKPNDIGVIEQINLPTSDGEFNFRTTLAASHSLPGGTFGSLYGSINWRTESFSNQWQSGLEIGHLFFDKLYLIGKMNVQGKFTTSDTGGGSFLYGEGTTFTALGVTSIYKLDPNWSLVAIFNEYTDLITSKRNIYDGATFSIGLSLEY